MLSSLLLGGLLLRPPASPSPEEGATPGRSLKAAVQHYRDALARARWSAGYGSLGSLYGQARALGPDRNAVLADETKDFLEKATPAQKQRFLDDLDGLKFSTPDAPPIPKISFFVDLNRTSTEKESQRFFALIQGLYSKTFTRAYEDAKVGCTRLGKGQAVAVFRSIRGMENHLPHYKNFLDAEEDAAMHALMTPCACLGPAESQREIQDFIGSFPKDPGVPRLKDHLQKIAAHDPALNFQCTGSVQPLPIPALSPSPVSSKSPPYAASPSPPSTPPGPAGPGSSPSSPPGASGSPPPGDPAGSEGP